MSATRALEQVGNVLDGETVIATSAWVQLQGCYPSRIILRHLPVQSPYHPFVVHTEVIPTDRGPKAGTYFHQGGYHTDLAEAIQEFGERALRDLRKETLG